MKDINALTMVDGIFIFVGFVQFSSVSLYFGTCSGRVGTRNQTTKVEEEGKKTKQRDTKKRSNTTFFFRSSRVRFIVVSLR